MGSELLPHIYCWISSLASFQPLKCVYIYMYIITDLFMCVHTFFQKKRAHMCVCIYINNFNRNTNLQGSNLLILQTKENKGHTNILQTSGPPACSLSSLYMLGKWWKMVGSLILTYLDHLTSPPKHPSPSFLLPTTWFNLKVVEDVLQKKTVPIFSD